MRMRMQKLFVHKVTFNDTWEFEGYVTWIMMSPEGYVTRHCVCV